jgi:2-oxoglutarate ferredoxin oxidoreductase subunit gamma
MDPDMISSSNKREDVEMIRIPAVVTADKLGNRIVANMVMLGALQERTGVVSRESLEKAIKDSVSSRFHEIDLQAMESGIKLVKNLGN